MENRKMMKIMALMMAVMMTAALALCMTACGSKTEEQPVEEPAQEEEQDVSTGPELSEDQMDDLYQQAAEKALELSYTDYMPDQIFGTGEAFSINREGDKGRWEVYLGCDEYVALDGKAYNMSGSYGEAILEFDYTADGPKLTNLTWSADGGDHDAWIKENFTEDGYKNWETWRKDENGNEFLQEVNQKRAEDALGVPVETENLLEIDLDAGTYEIVKTVELGNPEDDTYKFDTETIKEGKLEDLK